MVTKNLAFRISADDADALKSFASFARSAKGELKKASDALDDTRTKGQKLADGLAAAAEEIDRELTGIRTASDALTAALGDDFDRGEASVRDFVRDLQRAGLTFEEIEADADSLAVAIRKLDDVQLKHVHHEVDRIDDRMRTVGATTDKTRSVVANFAGNAAQELPGVAQALGPANVAIGQFAEYAAEGDINVRNLAKAIGPMVAATAGLAVAQHVMGQWSKATQASDRAVDDLTRRIRAGEKAIDAWREAVIEAGEVQVATFSLWGSGAKDVTEKLVAAGLTLDQTQQLIEGGTPAIRGWADAMRGAGMDATAVREAMQILAVKTSEVERATENARTSAAYFRPELSYTAGELSATAKAAEAMATGVNLTGQSVEKGSTNYQAVQDWTNLLFGIPSQIDTRIQARIEGVVWKQGRAQLRGGEQQNVGAGVGFGAELGAALAGIPHGAQGAIVTRPTLAVIGDDGDEAVVPLNRTPGSSPLPAGGLGGDHFHFHFHGAVADRQTVIDWLHEGLLQRQRLSGSLGFNN